MVILGGAGVSYERGTPLYQETDGAPGRTHQLREGGLFLSLTHTLSLCVCVSVCVFRSLLLGGKLTLRVHAGGARDPVGPLGYSSSQHGRTPEIVL